MRTNMPAPSGILTAGSGVERLLPPELQERMARVTEISSLPEVTTRIVQVVEDPKATAHDMHEIVRTDPALAAKILKVVNSAFYGLPAQIASLDRAILMLGLSAVKNIALAASLARLFKAEAISEQFAARDLWRHSIAVGVCARLLGRASNCAQSDEVFVAGLVHDLGLIMIQQLFPGKLQEVVERCMNESRSFCEVETEVVGADHQAFGSALASKWRFPPGLRCAIGYHHEPELAHPEFRRVVTMVYLADALCARHQYGFWLSARMQRIDRAQLEEVGVSDAELEGILAELPQRFEEAEQIFGD